MNPKELITSGGIKRGEIMILSAGTGIDKSKLVEFTDRQFQERKKNKDSRLAALASKKLIIKAIKHNFKTGKKIQSARSAYRLILEKARTTKMIGVQLRMNVNGSYGAMVIHPKDTSNHFGK